MVWIDTDQLRAVAAALGLVRDSLLPVPSDISAGACGFPELIAACTGFDDEARRAQLVQAREVDAVAAGAVRAAQWWERAEQSVGAGHPR